MSSELRTLLALLFTLSYYSCFTQKQSFEAIEQSLFQQLERVDTRQDSVDIYNDLAYNYRRISPKHILKYADKAIEIGQSIAYTEGLAYAYKNKGIAYYKLGNARDSAIFFFEQAIAYAERSDDFYTMAACINNIGLVEMQNLEFNQAIQNFLHSLSIQKEKNIETPYLKGLVIGNIGKAYQRQGKIEKAINYFQEAIDIGNQYNIKAIISIYSDDIASAYFELGHIEKAMVLLEQVLPIHDELSDYESKVKTLLRYSAIKLEQKQASEALKYSKKAYFLSQEHDFDFVYSNALMSIAKGYLQLKDVEAAEEYALLAYQNTLNDSLSLNAFRVLQILADIKVAKKDYQAAYDYQKQIEKLQQLLNDKQANRVTSELEALYQNEEKLLEIERLEKDANTNRLWIRRMSIFSGIVAILLLLIILLYRKQKKFALTLTQKNEQITAQSEELQQLSELKDKLFSTISHDLKSPIANFEQGLQYLLSGELLQEEFLLFAKDLKKDATQLRKSVEELMNWSYMQMVGLTPKATNVNLNEAIEQTIQANRQAADTKKVQLNNKLAIDLFVQVDQEHLNSIIRNLTSNAIKFSHEGGKVVFDAKAKKCQIVLSVRDDGIGIPANKLARIFQAGTTEWGTAGEKGTGLGLALCKEFVEQNGGTVWVESQVNKGSTFFVAFPSDTTTPTRSQPPALSSAVL